MQKKYATPDNESGLTPHPYIPELQYFARLEAESVRKIGSMRWVLAVLRIRVARHILTVPHPALLRILDRELVAEEDLTDGRLAPQLGERDNPVHLDVLGRGARS